MRTQNLPSDEKWEKNIWKAFVNLRILRWVDGQISALEKLFNLSM